MEASAKLMLPSAIAVDHDSTLYIADSGCNLISKVGEDGLFHVIAGSGRKGYSGDGGPARQATFRGPAGIAVDGSNDIYVSDSLNGVIRKVSDPSAMVAIPAPGNPFGVGIPSTSKSRAMLHCCNVLAKVNPDHRTPAFNSSKVDAARVSRVELMRAAGLRSLLLKNSALSESPYVSSKISHCRGWELARSHVMQLEADISDRFLYEPTIGRVPNGMDSAAVEM